MENIINDEFFELYKRNIDTVYQIALLHLKNKSDAEDATQTVFMKYLVSKPEFNDLNHERSWFILTSRNHCRDLLRNWWTSRRTDSKNEEVYQMFENEPDGDVTAALMKLPDKYKELIYLYYYQEYSIKEISDIISRNESTIRTQLGRAREKLRNYFQLEGIKNEKHKIIQGI